MDYIKIHVSFKEVLEPLKEAERGRLLMAMLEYAESGAVPDFDGNERFIWAIAKQNIDREAAYIAKQQGNGNKGGRPKNPLKPKETQQNPLKPKETQQNPYNDNGNDNGNDNENENDNENDNEKENITAVAVIKENATTTTDGMPFGLTEADIDSSLAQDQRVEDACKTWALPCSAGNIAESRDLIREYGEEWVMQAIRIAGGNKPTWGYVKGVLVKAKENGSMELPQKRIGKQVGAQQYGQRKYTENDLDNGVYDELIALAKEAR